MTLPRVPAVIVDLLSVEGLYLAGLQNRHTFRFKGRDMTECIQVDKPKPTQGKGPYSIMGMFLYRLLCKAISLIVTDMGAVVA